MFIKMASYCIDQVCYVQDITHNVNPTNFLIFKFALALIRKLDCLDFTFKIYLAFFGFNRGEFDSMKLWMITVLEHLTLTRSFVLLQIKTRKHFCDNVSV